MQLSSGKILLSSSDIDDSFFMDTIIFLVEYNEDGALGFIVNQVFDRSLNELVEFRESPSVPLYTGGPMDQEHLFFIHRRNDLISGGTRVEDDVYFGGDFGQAIFWINEGKLAPQDIKIFLGYCGWDHNDLESEIAEGSWLLMDYEKDYVFD